MGRHEIATGPSGLCGDSWPIEVGISWIERGQIQTWSSLIQPTPNWDLLDWSMSSEAVHGIPLSTLQNAPKAADVASKLKSMTKGFVLVSDAPKFELHWLSRLLDAGQFSPMPTIEDFDTVSFAYFDGIALDFLYEKLERTRVPHRAGPDSARLASGWLRAQEVSSQLPKE